MKYAITTWLFIFLGNISFAQLFSDHNYKFKTFTVKDGLAHNKVNKVLQDSKGFLWIATEGGLSRFDGFSFKNFKRNLADSLSLPTDNLLDIAIDNNDKIWLAYEHGFCMFDPINFTSHTFFYKEKSLSAQTILFNPLDGYVYFASINDGLYKIHAKDKSIHPTSLSQTIKHNVTSMNIDSKGILWLTIERHGYYKYTIKSDQFDYLDYHEWPMFIKEDKARNQYYTATWLGEFMIFDGFKLPEMNARHVLPYKFEGYEKVTYYNCAKAPLITGEDILWVVTGVGIGLFDLSKNKFVKYISYHPQNIDGLSNNWTTQLFIDRHGQIWISSWFGLINVNRVAQSFAKYYLAELEVNLYNLISGIADDPYDNNKAWMSVNGSGLAEVDKSTSEITKWYFKDFLAPIDYNYNRRWCHNIKKDSNGVLWVGSYGGYGKIKNGKVTFIETFVNGNPIYANAVFQDKEGMLWSMGRYLQLFNPYTFKYDSWKLPRAHTDKNLFNEFMTAEDAEQNLLYVGTQSGLFLFHKINHTFQRIEININKVNDKAYNNVRSLAKINNKLYIGTFGGLLEYNIVTKAFKLLLTDFIQINGISKDKFENLWIYGSQRLYRLNTNTNQIDKFDQNDGVYNLSADPAIFFEYNNEMYLGHRAVVTKFNPAKIDINNAIPIPYITELTSPLSPHPKNASGMENLVLKYNEADIGFDFSAIEYNYPSKLQFSYTLEGYDKKWSQYSYERSKSYTNLPHGLYTFKVKAKNSVGLESKSIAVFTFKVKPAFWQTWWFQFLFFLTILGIVYLIFKNRIRQIRRREKEKTEANKMIAELDAKLLRSQMNPHFIFNSLNSIQKYIWENNEEEAAEYLAKFAKLMRSILENSTKNFITVEEEFKVLNIYLELEHKRSNGHFDYSLVIDPAIDKMKVLTPPLLLQPFIENAIWHGLNKKPDHGNLQIEVKRRSDTIEFTVDDDGVGRNNEASFQANLEKKSMGIEITKQRIEKLFDSFALKGSIKIIDKINNGVSGGTCVIISLPIKLSNEA